MTCVRADCGRAHGADASADDADSDGTTTAKFNHDMTRAHAAAQATRRLPPDMRNLPYNETLSLARASRAKGNGYFGEGKFEDCLLYTSPSPRDLSTSRMPSSA